MKNFTVEETNLMCCFNTVSYTHLHLRDGKEYDRLDEAALSRSKADWIVGINGTRLFTTLYHKKLVVGRVQTPTLAMLVAVSYTHLDVYKRQELLRRGKPADAEIRLYPLHV